MNSLYALFGIVLTIIGFVSVVLVVAIVSSKKVALYDDVKDQRDALDKLMREDMQTQEELQGLSIEELRRRASEPF